MNGLADHLLGYLTIEGGGKAVHYGPQPYEGIVSEVCAAFSCPPDVAERQDWALVQAIFAYRNAKAAVELTNDIEHGAERLAEAPELEQLLAAMRAAQMERSDG